MTELAPTARHRWLAPVGFAASAAVLWILAGFVMFSAFMYYDDEGYVLLSLRNFTEHGRLYTDVFTQYGPFPFVFNYCAQRLGLELTHTAGRLLTLGAWGMAALACSGIVSAATRSLALRLAVLAGGFVYLWVMASEPSHPGGLITAVTAAMAWLGHRWITGNRCNSWAALAGAATAALLLTKVNVGVFAGFSTVAWLLLHFENRAIRRWAPWLLAMGVALLPFALMRPLLGETWALTFAVIFAVGGMMSMGAASIHAAPLTTVKTLGAGGFSASLTAAVIVAVPLVRGTTPSDLIDGILLRPLRHPVQFSLAFTWPPATWASAACAVVLFATVGWLRRKNQAAAADRYVALLRLLAGIVLAVTLARFPTISPSSVVLAFSIPWLWVFLWPLEGETAKATAAARWVALLFLGQTLHAFPVPGSQIAWGTFLILPVVAVGAWSATQWLSVRRPAINRRAWQLGGTTSLAILALFIGGRLGQTASRYREGNDLNLPGAERIRLPEQTTALYQLLTLNAVAHADVLFSLPGMFSFNLWTSLPTPTLANVTHWFSLLDPAQQSAIIESLERNPRACVIVQRGHLNFLAERGLAARGPLYDYIGRNFVPAFVVDEFEFCVKRDRTIAPLLLGEMITSSAEAKASDTDNTVFKMGVLLTGEGPIATVEIAAIGESPLILDAASARVEITPINLRGVPTGPPQVQVWPFAVRGPAQLSVYFNRLGRPRPVRGGVIVLRDAAGAAVAQGRLQQ